MCSLPLPRLWTPAVSLVMPCRDEASTIAQAINSLSTQNYPGPMELIVVNGQSTDGTADIIAGLKASIARPVVRVIQNPASSTSVGLNLGVAASRGEVIFTLGAHTQYPSDYVSGAIATLTRMKCDAVGSRAETLPGNQSRMARAIALALSCPFGVGDSRMRTVAADSSQPVAADTASCPAYRRRVFERIGLFNPSLERNQDIEFNLRLRNAGMMLVLDPAITSYYQARATLRQLAVNCFGNGYWVIRSLRFCRRPFSIRHLVPLAFLLGTVLALIIAALPDTAVSRWLPLLAIAGAYVSAGIASLLLTHGRRAVPETLLVFPVIHFSYGLGSLWALLSIWCPSRGQLAGCSST